MSLFSTCSRAIGRFVVTVYHSPFASRQAMPFRAQAMRIQRSSPFFMRSSPSAPSVVAPATLHRAGYTRAPVVLPTCESLAERPHGPHKRGINDRTNTRQRLWLHQHNSIVCHKPSKSSAYHRGGRNHRPRPSSWVAQLSCTFSFPKLRQALKKHNGALKRPSRLTRWVVAFRPVRKPTRGLISSQF